LIVSSCICESAERAGGGSEAASEEPDLQGQPDAKLLPRGDAVPEGRIQEAAHDPAQVTEAGQEEDDDDLHGDVQLLVGERGRHEAVLPRQPRRPRQQLQMQRRQKQGAGHERQAGRAQEAAEAPRPQDRWRGRHQHRRALAADAAAASCSFLPVMAMACKFFF